MRSYCGNQVTVHITENLVFHKRTKHMEVDYYLIRLKIGKIVQVWHVSFGHQLADLLTKFLEKTRVDFICDKFGMSSRGSVRNMNCIRSGI